MIQPHLPIRLPCYDFTPVIGPAFGSSLLTVGSLTSGITNSHGVTGGVYKTRERIHRDILIRDYYSFRMVRSLTSGVTDSHGVTGGVYKTRERIHRDMLIRDY